MAPLRFSAPTIFSARGITGVLLLATAIMGQTNGPVRWHAQYTQLYFDNIESGANGAPGLGSGLEPYNGALVVTDPALAIVERASIRLKNFSGVRTLAGAVPLRGNTTYLVEFKYHILNYGTSDLVIGVWLRPPGDPDNQHGVPASNMNRRAAPSGTFSAGAQTAGGAQYVFDISCASSDADIIIDDIKVLRQDAVQQTTPPSTFGYLESLPFPRLGGILQGATTWPLNVRPRTSLPYSVDQIEARLAFKDIIGMLDVDTQTLFDPASIRRLRQLNPNAVILPYRISEEQEPVAPPQFSSTSLKYAFFRGIPDDWYVKDTAGRFVEDKEYPGFRFLNISPFAPAVNGQTYFAYLLGWLKGQVLPSGLWDGVFMDAFWAKANPEIPNLAVESNPILFNFDYNRNGLQDETPASTNDMTRSAVLTMLEQFRAAHGDLQLLIGNGGFLPELAMAPYLNGSLMECANYAWNSFDPAQGSVGRWRISFDAYRTMQTSAHKPRTTIVEACGPQYGSDPSYTSSATVEDLRAHRLTLGTALLSDGFYTFDLHAGFTVPLWYDEYSVDAAGNAVEDRSRKGYLGAPLTDAIELAGPGSAVFEESFSGSTLPSWLRPNHP